MRAKGFFWDNLFGAGKPHRALTKRGRAEGRAVWKPLGVNFEGKGMERSPMAFTIKKGEFCAYKVGRPGDGKPDEGRVNRPEKTECKRTF